MQIAVAGSIATDILMTFPGRFKDQFLEEQMHKVSLSFLVDELVVHRGGVGANICYGMAQLGQRSLLVGSVGADFTDYGAALSEAGVDVSHVRICANVHTARFTCTTDLDANQIASFYTGAMAEARLIEIGPIAERAGGLDLLLIGADDPEAMLRHTEECRERGIPFAADPSQQLARMAGEDIKRLVDGARYLFTNEYEAALIEQKTGWDAEEILNRVGARVVTLGSQGVRISRRAEDGTVQVLEVATPKEEAKADPTGVGDAFRAGFIAGLSWGTGEELAAQVGCMLATLVIETIGTQEYDLSRGRFLERFAIAYGSDAAREVEQHLAA